MSTPTMTDTLPPENELAEAVAAAERAEARDRNLQARVSAWLALAAIVLAIAAGRPTDLTIPANAVGILESGTLERFDAPDEQWLRVDEGEAITTGTRLRTRDEQARIRLRGGQLTVAGGTEFVGEVGTYLLDRGSLLFEIDRTAQIRFANVTVQGAKTFRVDGTTDPRVGVYDGSATVVVNETALGASGPYAVVADRLQQLSLVDPTPALAGQPLQYVLGDPWDERLLADLFLIDEQVAAQTSQLRTTYGEDLRPRSFYDDFAVVDGALAAAVRELAPRNTGLLFGPPAETLVGVVVAQLLIDRAALDGEQAVAEVARLRDAGATWGIVLATHDLGPSDLVDAFDFALRQRAEEVAPTTAPTAPATSPAPSPSGPAPSPSPVPTPSPRPSPSPSPTPSPSPSDGVLPDPPIPLPDPLDDAVDEVEDTIEDLLPPGRWVGIPLLRLVRAVL